MKTVAALSDSAATASEAIRAELRRIVTSSAFDASERNRRFLQYIVEETLAGRPERIKAYSIATSVFGRNQSFDPQTDPIIRIEASRLRRSLERYYLTAGKDDSVLISVPKGSYVPRFDNADAVSPAAQSTVTPHEAIPELARPDLEAPVGKSIRNRYWIWSVAGLTLLAVAWLGFSLLAGYPPFSSSGQSLGIVRNGPAVFVQPFADEGTAPTDPKLIAGFTREIITGLTRFRDLFVFGPETSLAYGNQADPQQAARELGVDFILTGGVTVSPEQFNVTASLVEIKTGRYVWSDSFDADLTAAGIFKAREDIADHVVRVLAQPYGVIYSNKVKEMAGKPPHAFTSYECVLQFYQYWRKLDAALYAGVRGCLERVIVEDPEYADAFANLALVYLDSYRFGLDGGAITFDPRPRALELAKRAVELAPDTVQGYKALHLAHWLMQDVKASLEAAERGFALNPNDTEIMADLGFRLCMAGDWDRGLPLVQEAFRRNPGQPDIYRIPLFLHHYIQGRYDEALAEAEKVNLPGVIHTPVMLAMAHAQLGHRQEADRAVQRVLEIDPAYGDHVIADLEKRNLHPDLISAVVDGLRKAGLKI